MRAALAAFTHPPSLVPPSLFHNQHYSRAGSGALDGNVDQLDTCGVGDVVTPDLREAAQAWGRGDGERGVRRWHRQLRGRASMASTGCSISNGHACWRGSEGWGGLGGQAGRRMGDQRDSDPCRGAWYYLYHLVGVGHGDFSGGSHACMERGASHAKPQGDASAMACVALPGRWTCAPCSNPGRRRGRSRWWGTCMHAAEVEAVS